MKKLLAFVFALITLSHLSADTTMTWAASPTQISSSGVNASSAVIANDSSGNATAVWVENGNVVTKSLPFGGSWGSLTSLDLLGSSSSPKIGMADNGDAVAVWLRSGVVEYATVSGGTWTIGAVPVSSALETASNLTLAVDSSRNAVATWQNSSGAVEVATLLSGGLAWSSVTTLSSSGSNSPDVAIGNGTAMVLWHHLSGSSHTIQYSSATLGGAWSAAGNVLAVTAAFVHNYPKVTMDSLGNATAVWYRYTQSGSNYLGVTVLSASLTAGGAAWTAIPIAISNSSNTNPSNLPLHIRSDTTGNVTASWMQSFDGATYSFNANALPFGGSWQIPAMISLPGVTGTDGSMHMNSLGDAVGVFMAYDGTNAVIQSSDSFYGGYVANTWSMLSTASTGSDNGFPRIASYYSSGTIYATAVWTQYNGTNTIINARTGSRAMLLAPSNLSVTQSLTDYGIVQDYTNTITWTPATDPNAIGQIFFRNGIYVATLSLTQSSYVDHNQPQSGHGPVTYGIASVNGFNQLSPITTISFP